VKGARMWEWEELDDMGASVGTCSMLSRSARSVVGNKVVLTVR
jgi:hypothetical protein